jgi:hypothetical protein
VLEIDPGRIDPDRSFFARSGIKSGSFDPVDRTILWIDPGGSKVDRIDSGSEHSGSSFWIVPYACTGSTDPHGSFDRWIGRSDGSWIHPWIDPVQKLKNGSIHFDPQH